MANYLERVASSAGRRAAIAKPLGSGPPLLPAGKDLSLPVEGSLPSNQFFEASTHDRRESTPSEERATVAQRETKPAAAEPLSGEPPFTVHLPKTLRPVSPANVPPPVSDEESGGGVPWPASVNAGPTEFTVAEERPASVVRWSDPDMKQSARLEVDTTAPPVRASSKVAGPSEERKPPTVRPIKTDAATSESLLIPRVDRGDEPNNTPLHATPHHAEPLPPAVSPVPMPSAVFGNGTRQEQSRISIGSLEVLVNNHAPLNTVRPPASAPLRSEKLNLETRYLDRFRLRH